MLWQKLRRNWVRIAGVFPGTRQGGFTLVEMLVVVAVLAVLAMLLIPTLKSMFQQSKLAQCQSNLRQITLAGLAYVNENDGYFPLRDSLLNPWNSGGYLPGENPATVRPLNAYLDNNYKVFRCPADTASYPPAPGAPAWASKPFYESLGTSYFYNTYVGTRNGVVQGKERAGLYGLKITQIHQPSRMVFFCDQDARVYGSFGENWVPYTLWWHSRPGQELKANIAFVDGSIRLVKIVPDNPNEELEYMFYND